MKDNQNQNLGNKGGKDLNQKPGQGNFEQNKNKDFNRDNKNIPGGQGNKNLNNPTDRNR